MHKTVVPDIKEVHFKIDVQVGALSHVPENELWHGRSGRQYELVKLLDAILSIYLAILSIYLALSACQFTHTLHRYYSHA